MHTTNRVTVKVTLEFSVERFGYHSEVAEPIELTYIAQRALYSTRINCEQGVTLRASEVDIVGQH